MGAATGIGGIVRDVYCMGADVIGVMDPLRFGDPEGPNALRVKDITWGVVLCASVASGSFLMGRWLG